VLFAQQGWPVPPHALQVPLPPAVTQAVPPVVQRSPEQQA
jgi:hypothetical protein